MIWSLIGKAVAIYFLAKLICFTCTFLRSYVLPLFGLGIIDLKSYGDWAVVTGATDGIGKSYAKELAGKGLNLVLISRSQEKLDYVSKEIGEAYNVDIKTIAFDFGAYDGYEKIEKELKDMNIGILVNNVGVSYDYPEYFASLEIDQVQKIMNVNMLSAVKMTHIVLQGMVNRKKGILIHVASTSAYLPTPLMTIYSATKVFLDFFARALSIEYKDQGIISQSVIAYFVATKMTRMKPRRLVPDPDVYAKQALQTVGIADRTNGYWAHTLPAFLLTTVPGFLLRSYGLRMFKASRARALRRLQKNK